jgi:hypothetical protein
MRRNNPATEVFSGPSRDGWSECPSPVAPSRSRLGPVVSSWLAVITLACPPALPNPSHASTPENTHEASSHLYHALDDTGTLHTYQHDPVGSITAVQRTQLDPAVHILGALSKTAGVSATVTLQGRGFGAIHNAADIPFTCVSPQVVSTTNRTLVVQVPRAATTGSITVTVAGKSTTSLDPLTALAPRSVAAIARKCAPIGGLVSLSATAVLRLAPQAPAREWCSLSSRG